MWEGPKVTRRQIASEVNEWSPPLVSKKTIMCADPPPPRPQPRTNREERVEKGELSCIRRVDQSWAPPIATVRPGRPSTSQGWSMSLGPFTGDEGGWGPCARRHRTEGRPRNATAKSAALIRGQRPFSAKSTPPSTDLAGPRPRGDAGSKLSAKDEGRQETSNPQDKQGYLQFGLTSSRIRAPSVLSVNSRNAHGSSYCIYDDW